MPFTGFVKGTVFSTVVATARRNRVTFYIISDIAEDNTVLAIPSVMPRGIHEQEPHCKVDNTHHHSITSERIIDFDLAITPNVKNLFSLYNLMIDDPFESIAIYEDCSEEFLLYLQKSAINSDHIRPELLRKYQPLF